jgi:hypothetical protein
VHVRCEWEKASEQERKRARECRKGSNTRANVCEHIGEGKRAKRKMRPKESKKERRERQKARSKESNSEGKAILLELK